MWIRTISGWIFFEVGYTAQGLPYPIKPILTSTTNGNSETKCPTCGSICKIGGEGQTHFFIPVETNKTAEEMIDYYPILLELCRNGSGLALGSVIEASIVSLAHEFSTQQSKEKDEEIKRLKQLKLEHELFIGKTADTLGFGKTMELLKEAKDAFKK